MVTASFIFSVLNFLGFIVAGVIYFNKNYEILPKDVYQVLADTYEKSMKEEESTQELAGGCGFFREQVEEVYEDEEDE